MTKYIITKIEEKKVGQITLPNGIVLLSEPNNNIVIALNCHINPAYINIDNIIHNIKVVLLNYKPTSNKGLDEVPTIHINKELRIESVPCKNNLNTTWYFYDVEETSKEIDPSQTISIGLIENVIL